MRFQSTWHCTTLAAAALLSAACERPVTVAGPSNPPAQPVVAAVTVSPATASVQVGATVPLSATPKDASGTPLGGRVVTWASSAPTVATVSATGVVTGIAAGAVTITATSEGKVGTGAVSVNLVPVAAVAVAPATASIQAGQAVQLTATLTDAAGNVLTGRTVMWVSSAGGVATVSASGLVTGVGAGTASITATSGGRSGSAAVTVTVAPPSGMWTHEPAGFSGLATKTGARDYDWVTADIDASATSTGASASGWYDEYVGEHAAHQIDIVADPTAPFPANVVQITYPIGFVGGYTPGRTDYVHRGVTEYYIGFYFKISNPYQTISSGHNKIFYLKSPVRDLAFEFYPDGGNWHYFMAEYFSDPAGSEIDHHGSAIVAGGTWHKIEIVLSYSNSRVTWWIDGVLDQDFACNFNANAGGSLINTFFEPTYGGGSSPTKTEVDYVWFNHVHMSGLP